MSRREDILLLQDMLEHARLVRDAASTRSRVDLESDRMFRAACERFIEIVGEAASKVGDDFKSAHPDIPWRRIVGTRNILVHGYAQIDLDILWDIIEIDLPELIEQLELELDE
ncbi:MAG: DUF86 domain-containing protein [bacterium]|nr:DUF86 domain-containing protein [bacterium]